mgnify:CR=1 FL=1
MDEDFEVEVVAAGQPAETVVQTVPGRWRSFYENVAAALRGSTTKTGPSARFFVFTAFRYSGIYEYSPGT